MVTALVGTVQEKMLPCGMPMYVFLPVKSVGRGNSCLLHHFKLPVKVHMTILSKIVVFLPSFFYDMLNF